MKSKMQPTPEELWEHSKPVNILLYFSAKNLKELKLAENTVMLTAQNSGYMAPEYAMERIFSVKSDVFSFGVLLLEIISGKETVASTSHSLLRHS